MIVLKTSEKFSRGAAIFGKLLPNVIELNSTQFNEVEVVCHRDRALHSLGTTA